MKHIVLILSIVLISTFPVLASSFFELELANNVIPKTTDGTFNISDYDNTNPNNPTLIQAQEFTLQGGTSLGMYIGTEMALDFNMKLDMELGFHFGEYAIDQYSGSSSVNSTWRYSNYILFLGVRLKYDAQITESISLEPYVMAGVTPIYMFAPSYNFRDRLDDDLTGAADHSFAYQQDNILALDYYGLGLDVDLTRSSVEYSGSSKYLFGISVRWLNRAVTLDYEDDANTESTQMRLICLSGTVIF